MNKTGEGRVDEAPRPLNIPAPAAGADPQPATRGCGSGTTTGAAPPILEAWEYQWAGMAYRVDSPEWADLQAQGWTLEHTDKRYGTHLVRRRLYTEPAPRLRWFGVMVLCVQVLLLAGILIAARGCDRMVHETRNELIGVEPMVQCQP